MAGSFATAEAVIFAVLAFPTAYVLICHRSTGLYGWLCLVLFCILRVIYDIIHMAMARSDIPALDVTSDISALLLLSATAGILQEARKYRSTILSKRKELALFLGFHALVSSGIVLLAVARTTLNNINGSTYNPMLKAGGGLVIASWGILVIWALYSIYTKVGAVMNVTHRSGTLLLYSVLIAMPFIGIYVIYEYGYLMSYKHTAIYFIHNFYPEFLAVISFIIAGIATKDVSRIRKIGLNFG